MNKESKDKIKKLKNTSDMPPKEIIIAANIVCKAFKIEFDHSINKMYEGFILGPKDIYLYLLILRAYAQIMADIGINIDEFFNLVQHMDYIEHAKVVNRNIAKMSKDGQSANSLRSR